MINWSKINSINLILIAVVIFGLLLGGIISMLWTYPNDQGAINNAALLGENIWANPGNVTCCYQGGRVLSGPATVSVRAASEARYIVEFNTTSVSLLAGYRFYSSADGLTYVLPYLWITPSTTFFSFERRYVVFSYSFQGNNGGYPATIFPLWFTGPQGNLTQTVHTLEYGGSDFFHSLIYGTSIIEANRPGNYTLHYRNPGPVGSGSLNGTVVMGPSSVTFTRSYVYAGASAVLAGATISVVTVIMSIRRFRLKHQSVQTTKPSYMRP